MLSFEILTIVVVLSTGTFLVKGDGGTFCYDDPKCDESHWEGKCNAASKSRQSPIDLKHPHPDQILAAPESGLKFNDAYKKDIKKFYMKRAGTSIQILLNEDATSNLQVSGIDGETYTFAQIHFHWGKTDKDGSEHTVDGRHFALEAHFVHYKSSYGSLGKAAAAEGDGNALAVLGILYEIHPKLSDKCTTTILDGIEKLEKSECGNVVAVDSTINLFKLLFSDENRVFLYRYKGSLTTPPCTEDVIWTVFGRSKFISHAGIEKFRNLKCHDKKVATMNFRHIQKKLNVNYLKFNPKNG